MIRNFLYTVPTVKELIKKLNEISDWYKLGVLLDVPVWELKKIKKLNEEVEENKIELFHIWLKNAKAPTWETILCAVRQLDPNLAERLAGKVHQQKPQSTEVKGTINI